MKKYSYCCLTLMLTATCLLCFTTGSFAKIEWTLQQKIDLESEPLDIAVSKDGKTAFILEKSAIQVYSLTEKKVTDTIPLGGEADQIAISPDGESLFLTGTKDKQVTVIKISEIFDIEIGNSPVIGKKDASVNVVAFLDYQCPYCSRVYPILEQLIEKYPNDVNLIIKHFPLRMHKYARQASIAALAAARQDKYREMTAILLKNYRKLDKDTVPKHAEAIELDMEKFNRVIKDPALNKAITQDMQLGRKVEVRGVPKIFINGRQVGRDRSLKGLSKMVEEELKKK